jgi:hypothetical protein
VGHHAQQRGGDSNVLCFRHAHGFPTVKNPRLANAHLGPCHGSRNAMAHPQIPPLPGLSNLPPPTPCRQVIGLNTPLSQQAGYYCSVCDCVLRDSQSYLDHINGGTAGRRDGACCCAAAAEHGRAPALSGTSALCSHGVAASNGTCVSPSHLRLRLTTIGVAPGCVPHCCARTAACSPLEPNHHHPHETSPRQVPQPGAGHEHDG